MTRMITTLQHVLPVRVLGLLSALLLLFTGCSGTAAVSSTGENSGQPIQLRIGYQRGGEFLLLKAQRTLEERFGPNVTVTWTLFTSGPPLLEALNAGELDIGTTGDTPPIFAQAAGAPLVYVASRASSGAGSAIITSANSPIQTVEDLKGKKVAFAKASSAHLLLIKALEQHGLTYADIEPVFLQPPEARAALENGSVDAWSIWNPFLEVAIQELQARIIIDGVNVAPTKGYILTTNTYIAEHPDIVLGLIEELQAAQQWADAHLDEYADILEKETQIAASVWKSSYNRDQPEYVFIDQEAVAYQQEVADIFFKLKLIPEPLQIDKVVWYGLEQQ